MDISKITASEHDALTESYVRGELLDKDKIDYLRTYTSTVQWLDIEQRKRAFAFRPAIEAFPEASFVGLKSGSPKLTVEWTRDDGLVSVVWFDGSGVSHRDAFHPDVLKKLD